MLYRAYGKRLLDLLCAMGALVLLSPLLLLVAALIKMVDPGPIIFRQQRIGRDGVPFIFYKFRSMPVNTDELPSDQLHTVPLSWIGRLIRRTNIDELPQLINILKGDMSVVGPRPALPGQTLLLSLRRDSGALSCRPGLTGLAQISAYSGMSATEKARYDKQYQNRLSLLSDMCIILKTVNYLRKPPPVY